MYRHLNGLAINWKIVTGCTDIGPGCDSCPSLHIANEKTGIPGHDFEHGFGVRLHPDRLTRPEETESSKTFYVALGSDLFHDSVPDEFIFLAFEIMNEQSQHRFEIVTKRADRLRYLAKKLTWGANIYIGVTVASKSCKWRIEALRTVLTKNRFISICPILEDLGTLDLNGIQVVGVVEESWGPKRKADSQWIKSIERQCQDTDVIFRHEQGVVYA